MNRPIERIERESCEYDLRNDASYLEASDQIFWTALSS